MTLVIPELGNLNHFKSLSRIMEAKLVAAILSGNLEPSAFQPHSGKGFLSHMQILDDLGMLWSHYCDERWWALTIEQDATMIVVSSFFVYIRATSYPLLCAHLVLFLFHIYMTWCPCYINNLLTWNTAVSVPSSHSTDETIVAESDLENDTATSDHVSAATKVENADKQEHGWQRGTSVRTEFVSTKVVHSGIINLSQDDEPGTGNYEKSDVIYSQSLIVRQVVAPDSMGCAPDHKVVNFKCFRKVLGIGHCECFYMGISLIDIHSILHYFLNLVLSIVLQRETVSGNTFRNLIPFSNEPYQWDPDTCSSFLSSLISLDPDHHRFRRPASWTVTTRTSLSSWGRRRSRDKGRPLLRTCSIPRRYSLPTPVPTVTPLSLWLIFLLILWTHLRRGSVGQPPLSILSSLADELEGRTN